METITPMKVITRFAPSPSGFLHIGGARTALFNWLYARRHKGKFLLRIEDTDQKRSTNEAVKAIYDGIEWLGLNWDDDPVSQFSRVENHKKVVKQLLADGNAYKCYCSPDELKVMRDNARMSGRPMLYDGRWRDKSASDAPRGVDPVIRLKSQQTGETVINDMVKGEVKVANNQIDDMVLMRSDGSPTYMLAVVVDDHDMGITHVIRGDDHLTNTFRQQQIYAALNWETPVFSHIPLIHGTDGAKLSKRHGALGVDTYRSDGFLPEAMRNYLLRLGWSHGDDEIISTKQAIDLFNLEGIGKSPARFDLAKLSNLNALYLREANSKKLANLVEPALALQLGRDLTKTEKKRIVLGIGKLKERSKTTVELANSAFFYIEPRPIKISVIAKQIIDQACLDRIATIRKKLSFIPEWTHDAIKDTIIILTKSEGIKLVKAAQPLRAALSGSDVAPGIFDIMVVLGREETLGRLDDVLKKKNT